MCDPSNCQPETRTDIDEGDEVIASMFNLDHRLAELRPTEHEQQLARRLRRAAAPATRPARSTNEPGRNRFGPAALGSHLTRLAAI